MFVRKSNPHPSKLPLLSDEEIVALEKELRNLSDSWGYLVYDPETEAKTTRRYFKFLRRKKQSK